MEKPFAVFFSPSARLDLQEAFTYYETISIRLAERFLSYVDERLYRLSITPLAGEIRYEDIRCTMVKRFPYLIHYTVNVEEGFITVLRLLHQAQKPTWEV